MWKRAFWIVLILSLGVLPAAAQDDFDPLTLIPADFAGFVRLEVHNADVLTALDIATFAASFLQPLRVDYQPVQTLDNVISLAPLDVEDASFSQDILPWLGDEIVVAYQQLGSGLQADKDHTVLILPTRDVLQSASNLSRILDQQDILQRDSYRGATLYLADKITVVLTADAVLIGPTDLVKMMLDVQAGDHARLIDSAAYTAVSANEPASALVSGYLDGSEALRALSVLLEGDDSAVPILQSLGESLKTYRKESSLEQLVFSNALDGVSLHLQADTLRLNSVRVTLTLHTPEDAGPPTEMTFDSSVLNLVPQNAMIVQSGADARGAVYDLLAALPLANFAGQVVGAFPVGPTPTPGSAGLAVPQTSDMEQALGDFLAVLGTQANFDFEHDLVPYLTGSYAVALMPRPNDPLPPLNLPYDVLVVAQSDDPAAALNGVTGLVQAVLGPDVFQPQTVGDLEFQTVMLDGQAILQIGTVDDMLVIATGAALQQSLDARRGDDRLITRDRWKEVSGETTPQLYVDIPAVYGTFLPEANGPGVQQIHRLGVSTHSLGEGLFQMHFQVTLPSQFS